MAWPRRTPSPDVTAIAIDAVLFDFFGTLVDYQPDRSRLAYPVSHAMATALGYRGDHDRFVVEWDDASSVLDAEAERTHVEYSMTDAALAFAASAGLPLAPDDAVALGASYVGEWQQHVVPVTGATAMLRRLAPDHRLGIVSNTHDPTMVPRLVGAMGAADLFDVVVLSVEHGYRKPHASIYRRALDALGCDPGSAVFVGDSLGPDYTAPRAMGLHAFAIGAHDIPADHRLAAVTDLEGAMAAYRSSAVWNAVEG